MGARSAIGRGRVRVATAAACALSACAVLVGPLGAAPAAADDGVGSVRGVVSTTEGPAAFAGVVLTPVRADGTGSASAMRVSADAQGRFRFDRVTPGPVTVRAQSPGPRWLDTWWPDSFEAGSAGRLQVSGGAESVADITLVSTRRVSGRVLDAESGDPVAGAQVLADVVDRPGIELAGRAESDGRGGYVIDGLPPTRLELLVRLPAGSDYLGTWFRNEQTGPRPVVDAALEPRMDILLHRAGSVSGTVTDATGSPVAGALVSLDGCAWTCPASVRTAADGSYLLAGIVPDRGLRVSVWTPGGAQATPDGVRTTRPDELRFESESQIVGFDVAVPAVAMLSGHVFGVDRSAPLTHLVMLLRPIDDPNARYLARFGDSPDDPARFTIGPVPAGTYRLVVVPSRRAAAYLPVRWAASTGVPLSGLLTLTPGAHPTVTIRLATPGFLTGNDRVDWPGLSAGFLAAGH